MPDAAPSVPWRRWSSWAQTLSACQPVSRAALEMGLAPLGRQHRDTIAPAAQRYMTAAAALPPAGSLAGQPPSAARPKHRYQLDNTRLRIWGRGSNPARCATLNRPLMCWESQMCLPAVELGTRCSRAVAKALQRLLASDAAGMILYLSTSRDLCPAALLRGWSSPLAKRRAAPSSTRRHAAARRPARHSVGNPCKTRAVNASQRRVRITTCSRGHSQQR